MNAYCKMIMLAIGFGLFGFGASAVNGAAASNSDVNLVDGASDGMMVFRGIYDQEYCLGITEYLDQCYDFYPADYFLEGGRFFGYGRGFRGHEGHRHGEHHGEHRGGSEHSSGQHQHHR